MRKESIQSLVLAAVLVFAAGCGSRSTVVPEKKQAAAEAKPTPVVLSAVASEPAKEPVTTRTWGDYFFQKGDYRRSVAYLREEVKKDPQNHVKWRHLGSAYGQAEDYPNAIASYKKALDLNPVDLKAAYDLSLMLDFKGDFKEAQEAVEKGLSIDPNNAEMHASYGSILADLGKDDDAMKEYERALQLRPNDEITRFNKGGLHFKRKEMDKAEAEYRRVLKMNPGDLEAAENLASIFIIQNRLADAEKLNQWVIKKAPKDEDTLENAYFNLGIIYDKQEKLRPALDMYKLALQAAPWDAAAYVNAAVILERLGRAGEALAYWEKYDRLFPMNRRQEELKKRIAALKAMVEQQNETGEKPSPLPTPKN